MDERKCKILRSQEENEGGMAAVGGMMSNLFAKGAKNLKLATQMQHPEAVLVLNPLQN